MSDESSSTSKNTEIVGVVSLQTLDMAQIHSNEMKLLTSVRVRMKCTKSEADMESSAANISQKITPKQESNRQGFVASKSMIAECTQQKLVDVTEDDHYPEMDSVPGPSRKECQHVNELNSSPTTCQFDQTTMDIGTDLNDIFETMKTKLKQLFGLEEKDGVHSEEEEGLTTSTIPVEGLEMTSAVTSSPDNSGPDGNLMYSQIFSLAQQNADDIETLSHNQNTNTLSAKKTYSFVLDDCPDSSFNDQMSFNISTCVREDNLEATIAEQSLVPLDLINNVEHVDLTPDSNEVPSFSTSRSLAPEEQCEMTSAVTEEDLVLSVSTSSGLSKPEEHFPPAQVHPFAEQNVDDCMRTTRKLTARLSSAESIFPIEASQSPDQVSLNIPLYSKKDIGDSTIAQQIPVTVQLSYNVGSTDSTTEGIKVPTSPDLSEIDDRHFAPSQVCLVADQNVDDIMTSSNQTAIMMSGKDIFSSVIIGSPQGAPSHGQISLTIPTYSNEDIRDSNIAELSTMVFVDNVEPNDSAQDSIKVLSSMTTSGLSAPAEHLYQASAVVKEVLGSNKAAASLHSGQDVLKGVLQVMDSISVTLNNFPTEMAKNQD